MKHTKERKEKICLNCGAELHGLYCHECGQKNIEPRRPIWEIPWAFIEDAINIDGKFLKSVRRLIFSPGYLSKSYIEGKRHSFNDPVRIYLVTSFVFFIISSFVFNDVKKGIDDKIIHADTTQMVVDSTAADGYYMKDKTNSELSYTFNSKENKDSSQFKLTNSKAGEQLKLWTDKTKNNLPYLFWVSLPLFGFVLKLIYFRRKFFLWDHLVFSLGFYSFFFIVFSLQFLLMVPIRWFVNISIINGIDTLFFIVSLVICWMYLFMAMKKFYGQGTLKTAIKLLLLSIGFGALLIVELIVFLAIIIGIFSDMLNL